MTVIAYKDGHIACDSCWSDDGLLFSSATKIIRLPHDKLYGASGDSDDRALLDLVRGASTPHELPSRQQLEELNTDMSALVIFYNKHIIYRGIPRVFILDCVKNSDKYEPSGVTEVNLPFTAIGSGRQIAIGAMAAGASAVAAVHLACDWNVYCRPPVHSLKAFEV